MSEWQDKNFEHVRNMRMIAGSFRAHAKDATYPDEIEAYKGMAVWADEAAEAMESLIIKHRADTQTPPLLSQEEAFQRAVKAGMWNGLVSKPEDAP